MSIKRAFSKDTYTVARIINVDDGVTVRQDIEYKRGKGSVVPENLTSMLTTAGGVGLLVNNNLYTRQSYPLVADDVQGYGSDYFMWTDIDNTARWFQASGWRDWSRNGQNSYQQVLGTYDAESIDPSLVRGQDLTFNEIDNMDSAIGSMTRVVDLKMATVILPETVQPDTNTTVSISRYVYNLNGTTDFLKYNSQDTTNPSTQLDLKKGNEVSLVYKATTQLNGSGETVLSPIKNQYISIPPVVMTKAFRDGGYELNGGSKFESGWSISLQFKVDVLPIATETLLSGNNSYGKWELEVHPSGATSFQMFNKWGDRLFAQTMAGGNYLVGDWNTIDVEFFLPNGNVFIDLNGKLFGFYSAVYDDVITFDSLGSKPSGTFVEVNPRWDDNLVDLNIGGFGTSWVYNGGGSYTFNSSGITQLMRVRQVPLWLGRDQVYTVTFDVTGITGAVEIGYIGFGDPQILTFSANGSYSFSFTAEESDGVDNFFFRQSIGTGDGCTLSNIIISDQGDEITQGDFSGSIRDFRMVRGGDLPVEVPLRTMSIDEASGSVVFEDVAGLHGARINVADSDITPIVTTSSYLLSGTGVNGADLIISDNSSLLTTNPTWIDTIKFDGELIDMQTFQVPSDNKYHTIDITCNDTCNIVRLGTNETQDLAYGGSMYDFKVKKGNKETLWELKTYSSIKQDPFTLTDLSFGFNTSAYTNDNWSLITTGQK